jgi:hypothetical protein
MQDPTGSSPEDVRGALMNGRGGGASTRGCMRAFLASWAQSSAAPSSEAISFLSSLSSRAAVPQIHCLTVVKVISPKQAAGMAVFP